MIEADPTVKCVSKSLNATSSRAISNCSALIALPVTLRNRPAASAFDQLCSVWSESATVLVADEAVWPPRTRRMASCLNSSVYRARAIPVMQTPPMPILHNQPWGRFFRGKVTFGTADCAGSRRLLWICEISLLAEALTSFVRIALSLGDISSSGNRVVESYVETAVQL
jgi:hypothetical protein